MEITFCELRAKEVINIYDGRSLGNITDMVIDTSYGRVLGIIVPKDRSLFSIFKANTDFFIPYNRICKIGKDIILVELTTNQINSLSLDNKKKKDQTTYIEEKSENINNFKTSKNKKQNFSNINNDLTNQSLDRYNQYGNNQILNNFNYENGSYYANNNYYNPNNNNIF